MKKEQRGAISVEACTILLIFTFGMMALLELVNMVRVQVMVQNALNQSAKEISQYSYIVHRLGYLDFKQENGQKADEFDETVEKYSDPEKFQDNLYGLVEQFSNGQGGDLVNEWLSQIIGKAIHKATDLVDNTVVKGIFESAMTTYFLPDGELKDKDLKGIRDVTNDGSTTEIDYIFQKLGIKDVKYAISYCKDEENKIAVSVEYKMEYNFPFISSGIDVPIRLTAVTKAWAGGKVGADE